MTDDINTFPLLTILVAAVAVIISYLLIEGPTTIVDAVANAKVDGQVFVFIAKSHIGKPEHQWPVQVAVIVHARHTADRHMDILAHLAPKLGCDPSTNNRKEDTAGESITESIADGVERHVGLKIALSLFQLDA